MFTGIIDHCGIITRVENTIHARHLQINSKFSELTLGESIAIDGICLTVTKIDLNSFYCDISPETLKVTTANKFTISQKVNLERALQLSSRLGGHMVSGHVDQIAHVKAIHQRNEFVEMVFSVLNKSNMQLITKKGSIAINGVSLTINEVTENEFSVMLIPHTLEMTNLSQLRAGSEVNIECDMLARIIVDQCKRYFVK